MRKNVIEMSNDIRFGRIDMEVDLVKVTGMHCMNLCCALKHARTLEDAKQYIWDHNPTKVSAAKRCLVNVLYQWHWINSFSISATL
jgi:hypothetical protein